ncbi:acyl-CoA carboxylase epsilon subunit [Streptomyces sp. E11-3]|uniref:acyl-CoA carboxylase epsilon subunit n=1 Tax=Streptomyces sp. E11-3 TaxID=3110112 RepID=UPI0039816106
MPTVDIRIEKGEVTEDELAAVTVLLMSRAITPPTTTATDPPSWHPDGFRAPHSWQG